MDKKISPTDIELYNFCPRAYKISKQINKKTRISVLKKIVFCKAISTEQKISEIWEKEKEGFNLKQEEIAKETKAIAQIKEWEKNFLSFYIAEIPSKNSISTPFIDWELEANFDIIFKKKPCLICTSSQLSIEYLKRSLQTISLAYCLWKESKCTLKEIEIKVLYLPHLEEYKRKTAKNEKGDIKGDPEITITFSEKQLQKFEWELLLQINAMVEDEFFPMRVSTATCKMCQYTTECNEACGEIKTDYNTIEELE